MPEEDIVKARIIDAWREFAKNSDGEVSDWQININELLAEAATRNDQDHIPALTSWRQILDEQINWLVWTTFALHESWQDYSSPQKDNRAIACYATVVGTITHHAIAVRKLCLEGYDLPAKQVLRALSEYKDLLLLFELQPELILEFNAAQEFEDANKFWHKYLSKGKPQRAMEGSGIFTATEPQMKEWRSEERTLLSVASHPSSFACFACYTGVDQRDEKDGWWAPFLGMKSNVSVRTMRIAFFTLLELVLSAKTLSFWESGGGDLRFITFDKNNPVHEAALKSCSVACMVGGWAIENWDGAELSANRTPDHWFSD